MPEKKWFLRLDSIIAYTQTEIDGDEIFIKYNDEKVAPANSRYVRMVPASPVPLNVEIPVGGDDQWVELELWDHDILSPNDCLGKFRVLIDEVAENFSAELIPNKEEIARYVLNWSVVERS